MERGFAMVTRRQLVTTGTLGGAALLVPAAFFERRPARADAVPGGTLDPHKVPKYALPLFVLPAMPGSQSLDGTVETGTNKTVKVGHVSLNPGHFIIKVSPTKISGDELFRLRHMELRTTAQ